MPFTRKRPLGELDVRRPPPRAATPRCAGPCRRSGRTPSPCTTPPSRIERPECEPPPTGTRSVSPVIEAHLIGLHAEPLDDELGEARLVALARRQRADHHVDHALGPHGDLRALARRAGRDLDVVGDADAAVAARAAAPRGGAPRTRPSRPAPPRDPAPPRSRRCRRRCRRDSCTASRPAAPGCAAAAPRGRSRDGARPGR